MTSPSEADIDNGSAGSELGGRRPVPEIAAPPRPRRRPLVYIRHANGAEAPAGPESNFHKLTFARNKALFWGALHRDRVAARRATCHASQWRRRRGRYARASARFISGRLHSRPANEESTRRPAAKERCRLPERLHISFSTYRAAATAPAGNYQTPVEKVDAISESVTPPTELNREPETGTGSRGTTAVYRVEWNK